MKMSRSFGSMTMSMLGHSPNPFARISPSDIPGRMIPMKIAVENCRRIAPYVFPMHSPFELNRPLLKFLAMRRRMAGPSKSNRSNKMALRPG